MLELTEVDLLADVEALIEFETEVDKLVEALREAEVLKLAAVELDKLAACAIELLILTEEEVLILAEIELLILVEVLTLLATELLTDVLTLAAVSSSELPGKVSVEAAAINEL